MVSVYNDIDLARFPNHFTPLQSYSNMQKIFVLLFFYFYLYLNLAVFGTGPSILSPNAAEREANIA